MTKYNKLIQPIFVKSILQISQIYSLNLFSIVWAEPKPSKMIISVDDITEA
jgi:hypothetical protein